MNTLKRMIFIANIKNQKHALQDEDYKSEVSISFGVTACNDSSEFFDIYIRTYGR